MEAGGQLSVCTQVRGSSCTVVGTNMYLVVKVKVSADIILLENFSLLLVGVQPQ